MLEEQIGHNLLFNDTKTSIKQVVLIFFQDFSNIQNTTSSQILSYFLPLFLFILKKIQLFLFDAFQW